MAILQKNNMKIRNNLKKIIDSKPALILGFKERGEKNLKKNKKKY